MTTSKSANAKNKTASKAASKTTPKKTTRATTKKPLTLNEKLYQVIETVNLEENKVVLTNESGDKSLYTPVRVRVTEMRKMFGFDLKINTELMNYNESGTYALFKTEISIRDDNNDWILVSTGHSHESKSSSATNSINYLENAETSSVGRALANLGVDGGSTSETELLKQFTNKGTKEYGGKNIKLNKNASKEQIKTITDLVDKDPNYTMDNILKENKIKKIELLTAKRADEIITLLGEDSII